MRYFLENDELKVEIDSYGAEVKSVIAKQNMREYMWYGNPKYWGRTSPVLFPFVGSVKNKQYSYQGKSYPMGQHGFARDLEHKLVEQSENRISFVLESTEETLKKYPFPFKLFISYELDGMELKVNWNVENPGTETMYFQIGAHPAFLCPVHGEKNKAGYQLYFEGVDEIHHHGNDVASGLALMDEDLVLPLTDHRIGITEDFFDRCTYFIENKQTGCVGLEDSQGNRIVTLHFDTPLFAIWSPEKKNAPFLCIEPWYGRTDASDFEGSLEERAYTNVLEAGEEFKAGYSMEFAIV